MKVVSKRAKQKADVLQKGAVQTELEEEHDNDDAEQLEDKTATYLLFFGLYQRFETLETQVKDAKLSESEDVDVFCQCKTKREAGGFSCKLTGWLKLSFELRVSQLSPKTKDDSRFLKNCSTNSK